MFIRVHYWFHCWGLINPVSSPTCLSTFHVIFSHKDFHTKILYGFVISPIPVSCPHLVEFNLFIIGTLDEEYRLWCFVLCIILRPYVPSSFLEPNILVSTLFWNLCYLFGPKFNLCNSRGHTWFYCPVSVMSVCGRRMVPTNKRHACCLRQSFCLLSDINRNSM